jgi:multicomponent K+:H+ antiporter subunit G
MIVEVILSVLLVTGAAFAFIGSFGLVKLPDFYMRLHGPTKATTLGIGAILGASMIYAVAGQETYSLHELLITIFLFITAPISAHLLAKAALHRGIEDSTGKVLERVIMSHPEPDVSHRYDPDDFDPDDPGDLDELDEPADADEPADSQK